MMVSLSESTVIFSKDKVFAGSLSAKSLIAGDRIIDINGVPVSDKDVARDLLLKSLQVSFQNIIYK